MAKILLEKTDYYTNKAPRLPICICIDNSSSVLSSKFPDINEFIKNVIEYIDSNVECKTKVQLCIVAFNSEAEVISDFAAVDGTLYSVCYTANAPDLEKGIKKCIQLLNDRLRVYVEESISYYLPELLILSSGESSTDIEHIAQRLRIAQSAKKLAVTPFKIAKNDTDTLNKLTTDGIVYTELNDFTKIFECLKSGLELLSASSAAACKTLKSQAVGWEQLVEKR